METISDPKVTVLMSVYNGEKHLRGAVESILGQTFRDFEFLIVNDASEDSSREIILSYNDPRIRLIDNKENLGLTRSLNRGIQLAKGEYIVRQDDDDISLPERLEKGVETFERHGNIGLTGSSYYQIDEDGREIYFCKADTRSEDLKRYLPKRNIFCHGSVMFRKSCIEKVGSYREKLELAQDYDLWLRIAEKFDITNIREPMYKSRIGLDSLTFAKSFRQGQYRSFVLKLSEERRNLGKDRLDDLTEEEIESILEELLPGTRQNKRNYLSEAYLRWAEILYYAGNCKTAEKWLLEVFKVNPWRKRTLILAFKLLISAVLPDRLRDRLKSVKRRLFR